MVHGIGDIDSILSEHSQSLDGVSSSYFKRSEGVITDYEIHENNDRKNSKGRTLMEKHEEPNFIMKMMNLGFRKFL